MLRGCVDHHAVAHHVKSDTSVPTSWFSEFSTCISVVDRVGQVPCSRPRRTQRSGTECLSRRICGCSSSTSPRLTRGTSHGQHFVQLINNFFGSERRMQSCCARLNIVASSVVCCSGSWHRSQSAGDGSVFLFWIVFPNTLHGGRTAATCHGESMTGKTVQMDLDRTQQGVADCPRVPKNESITGMTGYFSLDPAACVIRANARVAPTLSKRWWMHSAI